LNARAITQSFQCFQPYGPFSVESMSRAIATCAHGQIVENLEYSLQETPCWEVVEQRKICCYPRNVQARFPNAPLLQPLSIESYVAIPFCDSSGIPIGLLGVMDGKPIEQVQLAESLLTIFAIRIATELERQQSESALCESEAKYRTLFDSIDEGFCVVEVLLNAHDMPIDYRVLEVNSIFEQQTGLQNAIGKTARQLNLEEHWIETYGRIALTGESIRFKNGSDTLNRWFDVYACRTGEPADRKVAIVFNDISDRKRAEAILQRAAKLDAFRVSLSDALRSLADPIVVQATASRVLGEYLGANRVAYFEVCGADYVVEQDYVSGAAAIAGRYSIDSFGSKLLDTYRTGRSVSAADVHVDPNLSLEQQSAYAAIEIGPRHRFYRKWAIRLKALK
jgi:PAS domain-containing protein